MVVEVESPSSSLVPRAQTTHSLELLVDVFVSFRLWMCVIFFFQATKGLEKGTGNCICGKIEQTGLSRSCMDRWTDGQMGEDARGSSMTPGGWQEVSAAEH